MPPVVVVLGRLKERLPPDLEALGELARVRCVSSLQELLAALPRADVLLVWDFRSPMLRSAWAAARRLKWVHVAGAGVDAVLFPEFVASPVQLTNARGVFDGAIAEYVLGLMLLWVKDLRRTLELQSRREWLHRETQRLAGAHLVVLGAGGIGRSIAALASCVGVEVTGVARSARPAEAGFSRILGRERIPEVLPQADFVALALPLTRETKGIIGRRELDRMKPTAYLINVGRGLLVEEEALLAALRQGHIAGAALDVFWDEPLPPNHPLWELPGVLISPHMSGDFQGWLEALSAQFVANFERWLVGEPLLNVVDKGRAWGLAVERGTTLPPH